MPVTRTKLPAGLTSEPADGLAALRAEVAQLRADNQLLARGLASLMVAVAPGTAPASFRSIATNVLHVYSHEQAERIEQIITGG